MIKAALDYRDYNLGVYGIELPMLKPWTSKASIIEVVLGLFDTTRKLVESPSTDSEAVRMSSEPNMQLPELASVLFACIHERLGWLGRSVYLHYRIAIDMTDTRCLIPVLSQRMMLDLSARGMNLTKSSANCDLRF